MSKTKIDLPLGCFLPFLALMLSTIPAWLTHIYVCFTTEAWGFLIAGAIFAPVAVVHGWGIWLGAW
jgi:hypothetical protein